VSQEIKQSIVVFNKYCYGLVRQLKSRFLSRHNKIKIYKTLIRPVLVYGLETWPLKIGDIESLGIFERGILRAIYGPTTEGDKWCI
jgi:ribosomal protein S28E/S33